MSSQAEVGRFFAGKRDFFGGMWEIFLLGWEIFLVGWEKIFWWDGRRELIGRWKGVSLSDEGLRCREPPGVLQYLAFLSKHISIPKPPLIPNNWHKAISSAVYIKIFQIRVCVHPITYWGDGWPGQKVDVGINFKKKEIDDALKTTFSVHKLSFWVLTGEQREKRRC